LERQIGKMKSKLELNKDMIIDALNNFEVMFNSATNEEKRALLRALIKEIHMKADRKKIKNIVFWFTEDDSFKANAILQSVVGRTTVMIVSSNGVLLVSHNSGYRAVHKYVSKAVTKC